MPWRRIPFQRYDPYIKTALNQISIERVAATEEPMIWVAGWNEPTVNIGRSQAVAQEIDQDEAQQHDTTIIRRHGGGGTTFLTPDGDLTWQLVAPKEQFPDDPNRIYQIVCGQIAEQLRQHGIEAEHEPVNDIVTPNGKLSGATLKQEQGVIYVAGTLLYDVDPDTMFSILTPDTSKLDDKPITSFKERVTALSDETDISYEATIDLLYEALLRNRPAETKDWTDDERDKAETKANALENDEWVFRHAE